MRIAPGQVNSLGSPRTRVRIPMVISHYRVVNLIDCASSLGAPLFIGGEVDLKINAFLLQN